jgi:hypothetical protein
MLTPEEQKEIQEHSRAIAKILYKHTEPERLTNLGQIEAVVRVNSQTLAAIVTCLGDGDDGVWNIIKELATAGSRREILDWFHLMENLHKVGGSHQGLFAARSLLWRGKVDETIALFQNCNLTQAKNFCAYLEKHRHRIVNYDYFQSEQICSIGSGSIESTIKQIDQRTKISGAQWKAENVPQVLAHRCAYLNGLIRDH